MSLEHVIAPQDSLILPARSIPAAQPFDKLLAQAATRFFVFGFLGVTLGLYGLGSIPLIHIASASFRTACFYGMGLSTVCTLLSFAATEWAFHQPRSVFMGIALGSVLIRMFNIMFAVAIGLVFFKLNSVGLITGLFLGYFSYLVIEIAYVHKKGLASEAGVTY